MTPADIGPDGRDRTAAKRKREREKAKRRKRTPEQRAAEHLRRQASEARAKAADAATRASQTPKAPRFDPRRTLVHDERPDPRSGPLQRRRADCAHLGACETAWAQTYGGAQAKCPAGCKGWEQRADVRLVSIGGRGGVSLG